MSFRRLLETSEYIFLHFLASNWLAERNIAKWVQNQNYSLGVAPASSTMLEQYSIYRGIADAGSITTANRTGRRFCQRFRRTWRIRIGILKVQETMPDIVVQQKVHLGLAVCISRQE